MLNKLLHIKTIALFVFITLATVITGCNNPGKGNTTVTADKQQYRCPMHHEIVRDKPGTCPICGMDLVPFGGEEKAVTDVNLNTLLKPTNSYVLTTIPVVHIAHDDLDRLCYFCSLCV